MKAPLSVDLGALETGPIENSEEDLLEDARGLSEHTSITIGEHELRLPLQTPCTKCGKEPIENRDVPKIGGLRWTMVAWEHWITEFRKGNNITAPC